MKQTDMQCDHLEQVNQNINAKTLNGCEECLQISSHWVALRLCLSCGHVGCLIPRLIGIQQNISK